MNYLIVIAIALLPAVLLWLYIYKRDPKPEPNAQLKKALLYGIAICMPAALIEGGIQSALFGGRNPTSLLDTARFALFVAALPEEGFKLLALWLVLRHNPHFDEHFDGIIYAVTIGLGFAGVENIMYIVSQGDNWLGVAVARALLAVPGHYAFGVLMGYYYSLYHFVDRSRRNAVCILLVPVIAHAVYDTLAFIGSVYPYAAVICFAVLVFFCVKMHKFANQKVLAQIQRDAECPPTTTSTC